MQLNNNSGKDTHNIRSLNIEKYGGGMTVIDVDSGYIPIQFDEVYDTPINDVAITNNGYSVIANTDDVSYYDNKGKLIRKFGNRGPKAIAINPIDNNILAIGTEYGKIELWNLDTGDLVKTIGDKNPGQIHALEFSGNGYYLMSADIQTGEEPKIKVWNLENGERVGPEHNHFWLVKPQISFNGAKIAYTIYDYSKSEFIISVVDVKSGQSVIPKIIFPDDPYTVQAITFEPNNKEIVVSLETSVSMGCVSNITEEQLEILRYSLSTGRQVGRIFEGQLGYGEKFGLSASSTTNDLLISTCSGSRAIIMWERTTARIKRCIKLEQISSDFLHKTRISTDGKYFLVVTETYKSETNSNALSKHQKLSNLNNINCTHNKDYVRTKSSNLANVTNNILKSTDEPAPVCAGISEFNILEGIALGIRNKYLNRYPISNQSSLFFAVYPSHRSPIDISLDSDRKKIQILVPLFIDIYHLAERSRTHRVSRTRVSFKLQVEPSVVVGGNSAWKFQLKFEGSKLDTNIDTFIIDPNIVLGTLGSNEALLQLIEETVNNMLNAGGKGISKYLSSLVSNSRIPNSWNRGREYELIFRDFIFKKVTVQSDSETEYVEYIFLLFTAVSHNFPPQCTCKEEREHLTPSTKKYNSDPKRWITLAFSEEALNILLIPHSNSGDKTGWGEEFKHPLFTLRVAADSYHSSTIKPMRIKNNNSMTSDISVGGGGRLSADTFDPLFDYQVDSASVGYDLKVKDVKVVFDIHFQKRNVISLVLKPTVLLDPDNIDYKFTSSAPSPINLALSWFVKKFLQAVGTAIYTGVMLLANIELIYDVFKKDNGFYILDAWVKSYNRSSIVFIAEATPCKPEGYNSP